jgi:hypothetical protein
MPEITPGQHFRDAQPTLFGRSLPDWVVSNVFVGTDGVQYAYMNSASNPYDRKTLSTEILRDKRRFAHIQVSPTK